MRAGIREYISVPMMGLLRSILATLCLRLKFGGNWNRFSDLKVEGYLRLGQTGFREKLARSKTDKASGAQALLFLPLSSK